MASKSDGYRERAAEFENKARLTSDSSGKSFYFELAHVYLQLAEYLERGLAQIHDGETKRFTQRSQSTLEDVPERVDV